MAYTCWSEWDVDSSICLAISKHFLEFSRTAFINSLIFDTKNKSQRGKTRLRKEINTRTLINGTIDEQNGKCPGPSDVNRPAKLTFSILNNSLKLVKIIVVDRHFRRSKKAKINERFDFSLSLIEKKKKKKPKGSFFSFFFKWDSRLVNQSYLHRHNFLSTVKTFFSLVCFNSFCVISQCFNHREKKENWAREVVQLRITIRQVSIWRKFRDNRIALTWKSDFDWFQLIACCLEKVNKIPIDSVCHQLIDRPKVEPVDFFFVLRRCLSCKQVSVENCSNHEEKKQLVGRDASLLFTFPLAVSSRWLKIKSPTSRFSSTSKVNLSRRQTFLFSSSWKTHFLVCFIRHDN